jgi:hypothetical protein
MCGCCVCVAMCLCVRGRGTRARARVCVCVCVCLPAWVACVCAPLDSGRAAGPGQHLYQVPRHHRPCLTCSSLLLGGCQFRTPELATQALQLSGINMMGRELRLARPSGYQPPPGGDPAASAAAGVSMATGGGAGASSVLSGMSMAMSGLAGLPGLAAGVGGGDNIKARKVCCPPAHPHARPHATAAAYHGCGVLVALAEHAEGMVPENAHVRVRAQLYVGNLPLDQNVQETTMKDFFNTAMNAAFPEIASEANGADPVEAVWMSSEKKFCFVTFRSEEIAVKGLQLDNIQLMGRPLRIGRPSDYVPTAAPAAAAAPGAAAAMLPAGVAPAAAAAAPATPATEVLRLANAVTAEDVDDEEEYSDILDDMKEECAKFGAVVGIVMPKEGAGKTMVYIKFDSAASAEKARLGLDGRSFESRKVEATFYELAKFDAETWE